jgi:hypothetical protein
MKPGYYLVTPDGERRFISARVNPAALDRSVTPDSDPAHAAPTRARVAFPARSCWTTPPSPLARALRPVIARRRTMCRWRCFDTGE